MTFQDHNIRELVELFFLLEIAMRTVICCSLHEFSTNVSIAASVRNFIFKVEFITPVITRRGPQVGFSWFGKHLER